MSTKSLQTTAFVLSLIGGVIIVIGSIIEVALLSLGPYTWTFYGMGPGMMSVHGFYGWGTDWMMALSVVALVFGVFVLVGALLLNAKPAQSMTWGILVLVFSVASFVGMGGYMIGAVLGIAGGALALAYRAPAVNGSEDL